MGPCCFFADTSFRPLADQHQIRRFGPASINNCFDGIDELFEFCSRIMRCDFIVIMVEQCSTSFQWYAHMQALME